MVSVPAGVGQPDSDHPLPRIPIMLPSSSPRTIEGMTSENPRPSGRRAGSTDTSHPVASGLPINLQAKLHSSMPGKVAKRMQVWNLFLAFAACTACLGSLSFRAFAPPAQVECTFVSRSPNALEAVRLEQALGASNPWNSEGERQARAAALVIAKKALEGVWSFRLGTQEDVRTPLEKLWQHTASLGHSMQYQVNSLLILHDLVLAHEQTGDGRYLDCGKKIIESWIRSNPYRRPAGHFAWSDHSTANRAIAICGFVDYCVRAGAIEGGFQTRVARSLYRHGCYLSHVMNHTRNHNHGLFQDFALLVTATHLDGAGAIGGWRQLAVARLDGELAFLFSPDGVYLENSPGYHLAVTRLLGRICRYSRTLGLDPSEQLLKTYRKAQEVLDTFMMPDGLLAPVGDTPRGIQVDVPLKSRATGLVVHPDAGWARMTAQATVLFGASHVLPAHKHCDDLSFVVSDKEGGIITDVGFVSYEPHDPARQFSLSWAAHNVVTTGHARPNARSSMCGIEAFGENGDYMCVIGRSMRIDNTQHQRWLLFDKAHSVLLIVDRCSSDSSVEWRRFFHFVPEATVRLREPNTLSIERPSGGPYSLSLWPERTNCRVVRGQTVPLQGWVAQPFSELVPAAASIESLEGKDVVFLAALAPSDQSLKLAMQGDGQILLEVSPDALFISLRPHEIEITKRSARDTSTIHLSLTRRTLQPSLHPERQRDGFMGAACRRVQAWGAPMVVVVNALSWLLVLLLIGLTRLRYSIVGVALILVSTLVNVVALLVVGPWLSGWTPVL